MTNARAKTPLPAGTISCPPCNGTGFEPGIKRIKCPLCKGEGILRDAKQHLPVCRFCDGDGREPGLTFELCRECGGWGRREWKPAMEDPDESKKVADLVLALGVRATGTEQTTIVQIDAGKPRTAHLEVAKLLQALTGEVRICDPYYGMGSLLRLDELKNSASVHFLTQRPDNNERATLPRAIQEYVRQSPQFEFRRHIGNDLHDRYIVAADELILLGHGLKDIGNKESFVVRLERALVGDTIDLLRDSFDQKWQAATPLP
jgi:hypothetical protein